MKRKAKTEKAVEMAESKGTALVADAATDAEVVTEEATDVKVNSVAPDAEAVVADADADAFSIRRLGELSMSDSMAASKWAGLMLLLLCRRASFLLRSSNRCISLEKLLSIINCRLYYKSDEIYRISLIHIKQ